jgi:DNA-binding NarL/FixJ family response regulator
MTYERRPEYPAQRTRIVIVDDHALARAGLRSMLAQERDRRDGADHPGKAHDRRLAT